MPYNPDIHNHRSIRLKDYDYSQAGVYFFAIVLRHRLCLFGEVSKGEMYPNPVGEMVLQICEEIPERFAGWEIDAFVLMPNQVHGILVKGDDGANQSGDPEEGQPQGIGAHSASSPTELICSKRLRLGDVIGGFKSITTHRYIQGVKHQGWPGFDKNLWQPDYHERIIRDESELNFKREYILNNPSAWDLDDENPTHSQPK